MDNHILVLSSYRGIKVIMLARITPIVVIIRSRTASAMMLGILVQDDRRQIVATPATVRRPVGPVARDGHEQRVD